MSDSPDFDEIPLAPVTRPASRGSSPPKLSQDESVPYARPGTPPPALPPQRLGVGQRNSLIGKPARLGKLIVAPDGCRLPARCVKCNEQGTPEPLVKELTWFPPIALFALLFGLLLGAIIMMLTQKKGSIIYNLCEAHHAKRRSLILTTWALGLTAPACVFAAIWAFATSRGQVHHEPVGFAALALFGVTFIGACVTGMVARPLVPTRISDGMIKLKGAGPDYLDTLPNMAA